MPRFSATIYKIGINPVVDPPERVMKSIFAEAGRSRGPIPVRGTLNGIEFMQTLVKYQGAWRLYINGQMLKASELRTGDVAKIAIAFDPKPRVVAMPTELGAAFQKDKLAKAAFSKLPPSRKKEILRYLGSLKTKKSLERNVARVIENLRHINSASQKASIKRSANRSV